ncbi:hypothetical protein [Mycoplasmoides gallisepticum]|uniref:hypothetical protein n=1 Tax=Mycoplasmoides gallisepticum TaxID=2096 RepID=UPI00135F1151|nr:hypothetical protein [Mycoplasmoides gallisepticum]
MFFEEEEEEEEEEEVLRSSGVWESCDQRKLSRFITYWTLYILTWWIFNLLRIHEINFKWKEKTF